MGRQSQACEPATEKALSPNDSQVFGTICSFKKYSFSSRLKALWLVISWSDVESEFLAAGPANAKLRTLT